MLLQVQCTAMDIACDIIAGRRLTGDDDLSFLLDTELEELCEASDQIRRELCGDKVDLCAVINGRQGGCSENCRFCSQSAHNHSGIQVTSFMEVDDLVQDCEKYYYKGIDRYSIVTAGKGMSEKDLSTACEAYRQMHEKCPGLGICASHGMLSEEAMERLHDSGVDMYHENIETSRNYFPFVCTSHTFDDKLETIRRARAAGMRICCGGIIGMGETWQDRIDMALSIAEIGADSIPLNALMPIKGTPFGNLPTLTEEDILRTICIFRFLNPETGIRLAAGRILMSENGRRAFQAGANATLTGDMLTTAGNDTDADRKMLTGMGRRIAPERENNQYGSRRH